jgi:RimJ/RimL family protein N-acetyltransferase
MRTGVSGRWLIPCDHAGDEFGLGLARLWLQVELENVASQHVAERCGFVREGRLRSHFQGRDGGRVDVLIYGLLPAELHKAS